MTKNETLKVLTILGCYYGKPKAEVEEAYIAWHAILKDYEFEDALNAVIEFAKHDAREYAAFPPPGAIIAEVEREEKKARRIYNSMLLSKPYEALASDLQLLISKERYEEFIGKERLDLRKREVLQKIKSNKQALTKRLTNANT